jgi:GNAT superfamily N-acetyltransferase
MSSAIRIMPYAGGEEKQILTLVRKVFDEYCSGDCDQFGVKVFYDFIEDYHFIERNKSNSITFTAWKDNELAGMIEMRDFNHVCLLFVDQKFQGKGIARELFRSATETARLNGSRQIDVNASLYSVPVYEKLGFRKTGEVEEVNGIRFVPMICHLDKTN